MRITFVTTVLLCFSNMFMTFAWYGHLKNLSHKSWFVAAIVSWGIAFFGWRKISFAFLYRTMK